MQVIFNFSWCYSVPKILRIQKKTENHIKISGTGPIGESSLATPGRLPQGASLAPCVWHVHLPGFENPLSNAVSLGWAHRGQRLYLLKCFCILTYPEAACGAGLLNESVKELMNKCHLTKLCGLTCHLYCCPEALAGLLGALAPAKGGFVFIMTSTGIRTDSFR